MKSPIIIVKRRPVRIARLAGGLDLIRMPGGAVRVGRFIDGKEGRRIILLSGKAGEPTPKQIELCRRLYRKIIRRIEFGYPRNGDGEVDPDDLGNRKKRLRSDARLLAIVCFRPGEENILASTLMRKRAKMEAMRKRYAKAKEERIPRISLAPVEVAEAEDRKASRGMWRRRAWERIGGAFRRWVRRLPGFTKSRRRSHGKR